MQALRMRVNVSTLWTIRLNIPLLGRKPPLDTHVSLFLDSILSFMAMRGYSLSSRSPSLRVDSSRSQVDPGPQISGEHMN